MHRTNVEMTAGPSSWPRVHGVGTLVLASTNAVIGDVGQATITEGLPTAPLTPYGGTKAAAEMLLSGYAGAFGLRPRSCGSPTSTAEGCRTRTASSPG